MPQVCKLGPCAVSEHYRVHEQRNSSASLAGRTRDFAAVPDLRALPGLGRCRRADAGQRPDSCGGPALHVRRAAHRSLPGAAAGGLGILKGKSVETTLGGSLGCRDGWQLEMARILDI